MVQLRLISYSNEQLGTAEINPALGSPSCRAALGSSGTASQTAQGSNCLPHSPLDETSFLMRPEEDSGTAYSDISPVQI